MLFEVGTEQFFTHAADRGFFYTEDEEKLEMWLPQNGYTLHSVFFRPPPEEEGFDYLTWKDDKFQKAIRVLGAKYNEIRFQVS